jgi:hypothetical protein
VPGPVKRLNYFDHQFLHVEDFTDEQQYHLDLRRRHNHLLHTWGVATGLELSYLTGATFANISAGVAIDGQGREIVLADDAETGDVSGHPGQTIYVTIAYNEQATDPTAETGTTGNRRIAEIPRIDIGPQPPTDNSTRLVLGRITVGADGKLTGQPDPGVDPNTRRAAGAVVAGDVQAASLVLSDRSVAPSSWARLRLGAAGRADLIGSLTISANLGVTGSLSVASTLAVTGDSHLQGNLQVDNQVSVGRLRAGAGNAILNTTFVGDVGFGPGWAGVTHMSAVGQGSYAVLQSADGTQTYINTRSGPNGRIGLRVDNADRVVMLNNGNLGLGVPAPNAPLHILGGNWDVNATEGDLKIGDDNFRLNIGVARGGAGAGDVRLRAQGGTNRLLLGGGTVDTLFVVPSAVGINTQPTGNALHVNDNTGIRQNRLFLSGGDQAATTWASLTYNAYHNGANNNWVFPDPTKPVMTLEMDSQRGPSRFEIYSTTTANRTAFVERLALDGDTGNMVLFGSLGIGGAPGARLDVTANTQTWAGWFEAIRLSQGAHSAITHPASGLLIGLHGDRHFYFGDMRTGRYVATLDANTGDMTLIGKIGIFGQPATPRTAGWAGGIHTFDLEVEGTAWSRAGWQTGNRDVAENCATDMALEPGELVSLVPDRDLVTRSTRPHDSLVFGVVSSAPAVHLNCNHDGPPEDVAPIALCGRVPCKVVDENGPIKRGDLLTSSSVAGHAMKVIDPLPGTVVGKALETHNRGRGVIDVFVMLA